MNIQEAIDKARKIAEESEEKLESEPKLIRHPELIEDNEYNTFVYVALCFFKQEQDKARDNIGEV